MKFYEITLFLFIINVFGSFFWSFSQANLGFTGGVLIHKDQTATVQEMENKTQMAINTEEVSGSDPVTFYLSLTYKAIMKIATSIFNPLKDFVLWLPMILILFEIPTTFAYGIGTVFWVVQIIGMAQFITGRSLIGAE